MGGVPKFDRLRLDCDDIDRSRDWRENAFDGSPRVGMNQMPRHVEERVQYQSMSPRARTVLRARARVCMCVHVCVFVHACVCVCVVCVCVCVCVFVSVHVHRLSAPPPPALLSLSASAFPPQHRFWTE